MMRYCIARGYEGLQDTTIQTNLFRCNSEHQVLNPSCKLEKTLKLLTKAIKVQ